MILAPIAGEVWLRPVAAAPAGRLDYRRTARPTRPTFVLLLDLRSVENPPAIVALAPVEDDPTAKWASGNDRVLHVRVAKIRLRERCKDKTRIRQVCVRKPRMVQPAILVARTVEIQPARKVSVSQVVLLGFPTRQLHPRPRLNSFRARNHLAGVPAVDVGVGGGAVDAEPRRTAKSVGGAWESATFWRRAFTLQHSPQQLNVPQVCFGNGATTTNAAPPWDSAPLPRTACSAMTEMDESRNRKACNSRRQNSRTPRKLRGGVPSPQPIALVAPPLSTAPEPRGSFGLARPVTVPAVWPSRSLDTAALLVPAETPLAQPQIRTVHSGAHADRRLLETRTT